MVDPTSRNFSNISSYFRSSLLNVTCVITMTSFREMRVTITRIREKKKKKKKSLAAKIKNNCVRAWYESVFHLRFTIWSI